MNITKIDRTACRLLSGEIEAALQTIAQKYGLSIRSAGGRFSESEYTCKVECQVKTTSGIPASFAIEAKMLGLPEDCHGKVFRSRDRSFQITGIEIRRPKMPVSAKDVSTGKGFKFPVEDVLRGLGLPVPVKQFGIHF